MTERWDVYDLDRRPVGLTRPRGFAHPPEQCQLVVHVCLFNKQGEMLIQRRSMAKKSYPGRWDVSVGGGVLAGETAREAAVREAREELGIEIDLTGPAAVTLAFEGGFDDYFLADWDGQPEALTLQTEEVMDARWATRAEMLEMLQAEMLAPFWPSFLHLLFDLHRHLGLSE